MIPIINERKIQDKNQKGKRKYIIDQYTIVNFVEATFYLKCLPILLTHMLILVQNMFVETV